MFGAYAIPCDELAICSGMSHKTSTDCCWFPFLKSDAYACDYIMTLKWCALLVTH